MKKLFNLFRRKKLFNLEKALAGEDVVTRNGDIVSGLVLSNRLLFMGYSYPIHGVVNSELYCWTKKGEFIAGCTDSLDLFMN